MFTFALACLFTCAPPPARTAPFELRIPELGAARASIESAHPECTQHLSETGRGSQCTVYSVIYDTKGVDSSWGWCLGGSGCVPRWIYHFDRAQRLVGFELRVESVDVDEEWFDAHSKMASRMLEEAAKKLGKPLTRKDFGRTHAHLERAKRDVRLALCRASWRLRDGAKAVFEHDAYKWHHRGVVTRIAVGRVGK